MADFEIKRESGYEDRFEHTEFFRCCKGKEKVGELELVVSKMRRIGSALLGKNRKNALVHDIDVKGEYAREGRIGIGSTLLLAAGAYLEKLGRQNGTVYVLRYHVPMTRAGFRFMLKYFGFFRTLEVGGRRYESIKAEISKKYKNIRIRFNKP